MEAAQLFSQWSRKLDLPDVEAWCLGQERRNPAPRNGDNAVFIAGLQSWLNAHLGNKSVVHNPARVVDRVMEYVSWLCANAMMDMAIMLSQELFASKEHTEFYFPGSPSPKRAEAIAALRMSSSELQALKNKVNN